MVFASILKDVALAILSIVSYSHALPAQSSITIVGNHITLPGASDVTGSFGKYTIVPIDWLGHLIPNGPKVTVTGRSLEQIYNYVAEVAPFNIRSSNSTRTSSIQKRQAFDYPFVRDLKLNTDKLHVSQSTKADSSSPYAIGTISLTSTPPWRLRVLKTTCTVWTACVVSTTEKTDVAASPALTIAASFSAMTTTMSSICGAER
jgi:hypothetical protein